MSVSNKNRRVKIIEPTHSDADTDSSTTVQQTEERMRMGSGDRPHRSVPDPWLRPREPGGQTPTTPGFDRRIRAPARRSCALLVPTRRAKRDWVLACGSPRACSLEIKSDHAIPLAGQDTAARQVCATGLPAARVARRCAPLMPRIHDARDDAPPLETVDPSLTADSSSLQSSWLFHRGAPLQVQL